MLALRFRLGYVYVASIGKVTKIGSTGNIKRRIAHLRATRKKPVVVEFLWQCRCGASAHAVEAVSHFLLSQYRVGPECYSVTGVFAADVVKAAAKNLRYGISSRVCDDLNRGRC